MRVVTWYMLYKELCDLLDSLGIEYDEVQLVKLNKKNKHYNEYKEVIVSENDLHLLQISLPEGKDLFAISCGAVRYASYWKDPVYGTVIA